MFQGGEFPFRLLELLFDFFPIFFQVIHNHFWLKKDDICSEIDGWIAEMTGTYQNQLKTHYDQLKKELKKLQPPPGIDDVKITKSPARTSVAADNHANGECAAIPMDGVVESDSTTPCSTTSANFFAAGSSTAAPPVQKRHTDAEIFGAMEEEIQEELNNLYALESDEDDDDIYPYADSDD